MHTNKNNYKYKDRIIHAKKGISIIYFNAKKFDFSKEFKIMWFVPFGIFVSSPFDSSINWYDTIVHYNLRASVCSEKQRRATFLLIFSVQISSNIKPIIIKWHKWFITSGQSRSTYNRTICNNCEWIG